MVHFIDVNIPIYAVGGEEEHKRHSIRVLTIVAEKPSAFVTSAEALQEIVHFFRRKNNYRWDVGQIVLEQFAETMFGRIEPVFPEDVLVAGDLGAAYPHSESRDLVHAAVMRRLGINGIVSADKGFDRIDGIMRLDPARVAEWETSI